MKLDDYSINIFPVFPEVKKVDLWFVSYYGGALYHVDAVSRKVTNDTVLLLHVNQETGCDVFDTPEDIENGTFRSLCVADEVFVRTTRYDVLREYCMQFMPEHLDSLTKDFKSMQCSLDRHANVFNMFHDWMPYGFVIDKEKGLVVFNRNYQPLHFIGSEPILSDVNLSKKDIEEISVHSVDTGFLVADKDVYLSGPTYYFYSECHSPGGNYCDMMDYLERMGKFLPLVLKRWKTIHEYDNL